MLKLKSIRSFSSLPIEGVFVPELACRGVSCCLPSGADKAADVAPEPLQEEQESQQVEEHSDGLQGETFNISSHQVAVLQYRWK